MSTPDAAELAKLAKEAKDALATLQQDTKATGALAEDTKKNLEAALHKFQDVADKVTATKALQEKAEKDFTDQIADLKKQLDEVKKGSIEYETRAKHLELMLATKTSSADGDKRAARENSATYKAFFEYYRKGVIENPRDLFQFAPELAEFKTLRTDNDVQGGHLIPQIMDNEIRRNITEMSPVRMYARTRVAPGKSMDIPRRLALLLAHYEGEAEMGETDKSTYGSEQVTLYRQTVTVPATLDMMLSSAFDLEREIASDVGESFAKGEGLNFLKGSGNKGPQGLIADTRIEVVQTGTSGALDFLDMANIAGKLKRGQNPMWFFNRRTLSALWQIKSSIGVPIWQPVAGETPATVWGFPYDSNMIDLDDSQTGSNAKPILFGDMRRCYEIFDMMGMSVVRDDLTRKKEAITEWTFRRYNTGRVIIPEAMKILKIQ